MDGVFPGAFRLERPERVGDDPTRSGFSALNLLAVHVRQTDGGQFLDVGIVEWVEEGR